MRHLDHAKTIELEAQAREPRMLDHPDGERGGMADAQWLSAAQR
jgi:hypothetical protein